MKKIHLLFLLLLFAATTVSAQSIVKGDMNDDNDVTIADVTSLVNVVLGKSPMETITVGGGNPYAVDNSSVVGTWYAPDGTSFSFNEDGTTTFPGGATYEFMPQHGRLLVYDAMNRPIKALPLLKVESEYLLTVDYATSVFTYYTNQGSLVTGLSITPATVTMNPNATQQLSVTATPENAFNPNVTWTSSNERVATVDQNGLVTGVAGGTCNITATTTDGSGQTATCAVTVIQMVTSITLSQTSLALALDGYKKLTATVVPSNAANPRVTWSSSDDNVAEVTSTGGVAATGRGSCIITCTAADGSGVTAKCVVYVHCDDDYVDLGLPSGTLWATCNVGAASPEDYGDYFAWGETEGYNSGKTVFSFSTYKWCNGSHTTITKYCTLSDYGYNDFTDNKTELDSEDDAASLNWGATWRMPSKEQFDELINNSNTTTEWTTQNDVYGRKITSNRNGNSIFLPAAGYCDAIYLGVNARSRGFYSSRTLNESSPDKAWSLTFNSNNTSIGYGTRVYGNGVRPVRNQ